MKDQIDGAAVIVDKDEVPHRRPVVVQRQREVVDRVGDQHRDQLFRVLVRAVVVGSAGDEQRQPETFRVSPRKVLASGLARRVRATRLEAVLFAGPAGVHVAVHLVGAHEQEGLVAMLARRLAQHRSTAHVGFDEGERVHERAVDVRLGGEVDYRVSLGRERVDELRVADVALHEPIAGLAFELDEVGQIARVGQLVQHGDLDVRARGADQPNEVRADETCCPGDQQPAERTSRHLMEGPEVQSYPIFGSSCGIRPSSSGS